MIDTTYRVISDAVLANLKSRCANIRNYGGIANELKPGYRWDQSSARARFKWEIDVNTAVNQESDTNLENSYNSFMNERGVNLDEKVTSAGLLNYFVALSIWCASHIVIVSSQLRNDRIICYRGGNTDLSIPVNLNKDWIVHATDVTSLIQVATQITTNNTKNYFVRYHEDLYSS